MKNIREIIGFIGAACTFACIYAVSAAPIPLYALYQRKIGFTNAYLSLSSVIYFGGTVLALLVFARVSNYLGRKCVIVFIIFLSISSCLIFYDLQNTRMFLIGRFIQGISCGMASSTVAAYLIDTTPKSMPNIGTFITGNIPMLGLAVGAIASGILRAVSMSVIFKIMLILLLICCAMITAGKESVTKSKGVIKSLIPHIEIPKNVRYLFPAASAVFIGTWAIGGFYQTFSATIALKQFGIENTIVPAVIFTFLQLPSLIGGTAAGKLKTEKAQKLGIGCFFITIAVIIFSLQSKNIFLFFTATVCAGIFWSLAFTGSIKGILSKTETKDRASVLSAVYLISYGGAAVPILAVGYISRFFDLFQIAVGYGVLVGLCCLFVFYKNNK